MRVNLVQKVTEIEDLIPQTEVAIVKVINLSREEFETFMKAPLDFYDFVKNNIKVMYFNRVTNKEQCIAITTDEYDFGFLIQSEGYHYARYTAYISKADIEANYGRK